jgi:hypothetical protein
MIPDLYWDGLFEVIERTLNPARKRTPAPPSKRLTKSKPKSKKARASWALGGKPNRKPPRKRRSHARRRPSSWQRRTDPAGQCADVDSAVDRVADAQGGERGVPAQNEAATRACSDGEQ